MSLSNGWTPPPKRAPQRTRVARSIMRCEFEITSKNQLRQHTKDELVNEVHRLQTNMRELAVTCGIARRTPSSEYCFDAGFVSDMIAILKASWSFNL